MAELPPVYVEFKGNIDGFQQAVQTATGDLKSFDNATKNTNNAVQGMSAKTVAAGVVMGNIIADLAGKVMNFSKEFVTKYQEIGKETSRLSRALGGSAEDMSRLRYAGEAVGVGADDMVRSFSLLNRHLVANDSVAKSLGITYRNAKGELLPTNQIIMQMADKFNATANGAAKTSLALQAFGRSGRDLIPLLNLGSAGLQEMFKNADKLGLTLSGKDLEAVKQYTIAQREWKAQVDSIQLLIGKELLPKVTTTLQLIRFGTTVVSDFVKTHQGLIQVIGAVVAIVATLKGAQEAVTGVTELWTKAQEFLNAVMGIFEAPAIAVIAIIAALAAAFIYAYKNVEGFANATQQAIGVVATYIGKAFSAAAGAIKFLVDAFLNGVKGIAGGAAKLAPMLQKVGIHWLDGAQGAVGAIDNLKNSIDSKLSSIQKNAVPAAQKIGASFGKSLDKAMNMSLDDIIGSIKDKMKTSLGSSLGAGTSAISDSITGGAGGKAVDAEIEKIKLFVQALQSLDAQFTAARASATTLDKMKEVAVLYLAQAKQALAAAQAEEEKTRNTNAHTEAVDALNAAYRQYAEVQNYANQVAKDTGEAINEAADAALRQAEAEAKAAEAAEAATRAAERELALMSRRATASNSWLAAQARTSGPTQQNFGGFIEVPVVIDGQVLFRATQKYSLINNTRNVSNGLSVSGGLI